MIQFEDITKSYPTGTLFKNVNISIKHGMRVGLVGKNGSGKTTLLRLMLGTEDSDSGIIKKEKMLSIGYLPQDIIVGTNKSILDETLSSIPELKELEEKINTLNLAITKEPENSIYMDKLGEVQSKFESIGGWSLEKNAKKILGGLGFTEENLIQSMEKFSGGWRMRVALGSILLQSPDILFLDEPTNHLDLEATIWLEKFLAKWRGGMVIISHDREFLDRSINHIMEIDLKQVKLYRGNYSEFVKAKHIQIEQHRSAYKNQQKEIKNTEGFIDRFRYKNTKATQVQSRIKKLEKMEKIEIPIEDKSKINLKIPQPDRLPLKVASCINLTKNYGKLNVLSDLNFVVERGNKIGLVGINGAGKTTLLKILAGVEEPTKGQIKYGPKINIGYYAQHQLEVLVPSETVFESLDKICSGWNEKEVRTYLGGFLFTGEEIHNKVKVLSGGEKARLALARVLVSPSHLLLLDEPTNHLDMMSRVVIEEALKGYRGVIVCISHDRHFLNMVTNTTCEVVDRTIKIYDGNYEYFEWKKIENAVETIKTKEIKSNNNKKSLHEARKRNRNRIAWIKKRLVDIEEAISKSEIIINDPLNMSNAELLESELDNLQLLENEYLELL
ncbi:MAG: ABC-F family ATP-binding cassette domain-containing protein, partial [Candidatus Neomarinimicrobiota bacterium]